MALVPICINTTNQCGGASPLPPCVGNCGGSGGDCNCWQPFDPDQGYAAGDVVQVDGQLYTANADIPPGTPFVIGESGQTWRLFRVGVTTIPPFDPAREYYQFEAVNYNGLLYTANTNLPAGPFNPVDWTEISSDGVIVSNDTPTVTLTGDGTALDPLEANVNLDPAPGNLLQETAGGLSLTVGDIPFPPGVQPLILSQGRTFWVDAVTGNDATGTGDISAPFATVPPAMLAANVGDVIKVYPGVYDGNVTWKENVLIEGFATTDSPLVTLRGNFLVPAGITRAKARNLLLRGLTAGTPTLTLNNSAGRLVFDNVSIDHASGAGQTVIAFIGNNTNWFSFIGGGISGIISMTDVAQVSAATLYLINGAGAPQLTVSAPNANVIIADRLGMGQVVHGAGALLIKGVDTLAGLDSSANVPGRLVVLDTSLVQANGTYGTLSKTGTAPYSFNGFARNPLSDESAFTGPKTLIELARDIHAQYVPTHYAPTSADLVGHLIGLDNATALGQTVAVQVAFSFSDGWDAGETVASFVTTELISFAENFTDSLCLTDTTDVATFQIIVDANPVGLVSLSGGVATFTGSSFDLSPGMLLQIVADDALSFGYLALTLQGSKIITYNAP